MQTPTDQQVKDYIESVPGLRDEWGIPSAKRLATIMFALMNACLVAITVGAIAYFMFGDPKVTGLGFSGIIIVLVLTYVVSGLRVFQLRAERAELPAYRKALANGLSGDPEADVANQTQVDASFKWESLRYRTIARMIGIAGLVIITLNTYQTGQIDYSRVLLFDGMILAFLFGAFWNNYAFKVDVLEVELEERSRATIKWQSEHPGAAQAEERVVDEAPALAGSATGDQEQRDDPDGQTRSE